MAKKKRVCLVCGTEYEYCYKCDHSTEPKLWKTTFCSENCRDIYKIINKYAFGHITEAQARAEFKSKGLDLSNKKNFDKEIKDMLSVIFAKKEEEEKEEVSE